MREAGVVIGPSGHAFYWHLPDNRCGGEIPDSRPLWDVLWENRKVISGFAHSHPGGCAGPSHMDITTFSAIERGLGRRLDWWILADDILVLCHWIGPGLLSYESLPVEHRPKWVFKLREASQT